MVSYVSDRVGKPIKDHLCRICNEITQKGEECHFYTGVEDVDGFFSLHFHTECWEYSRSWDWWDWETMTPGCISRKEVNDINLIDSDS